MKYKVSFDIDFERNIYPGKFIVLEGIEASGKTTQVARLGKKFPNAVLTKNPTNSQIGTLIRNEVLGGNSKITPVAYQYLFAADREIQQEEIVGYLKEGKTVVSDRYFWSSVAYGIADREDLDYEDWENISLTAFSILSMYHQFIMPDISIYLDITLEESLKRMKGSSKHTEIYDNHKMNVKIQKGYKWLLEKFPEEFKVLNAEQSEEELTVQLQKLIEGINK